LGGTLSATASQGVATFSGLTINKVGSGYTLQVTSSGLSSAVTNAIDVTKTGKSGALPGTTATGPIGVSSNEARVDPSPASLAIGPIDPATTPSPALPDPGLVAQALDSPGLLDGWLPGRRRRSTLFSPEEVNPDGKNTPDGIASRLSGLPAPLGPQ